MKIAVDFDGTIVKHAYPHIGEEYPFAIETLKQLQEDGHQIVLWSVREGKSLEKAVEYCRNRGLEFYAVNSEFPDASWSGHGVARKIKADVYIDDRNLGGIPDWGEIYQMISEAKDEDQVTKHKSRKSGKHCDFISRLREVCATARENVTFRR